MNEATVYALLSAIIVSAVSLVAALSFLTSAQRLKQATHLLVSLAAGAMLGNAILHLLPGAVGGLEQQQHAAEKQGGCACGHDHDHDHDKQPAQAGATEHDHHDHGHAHHGPAMIAAFLVMGGFFGMFALDLTLLSLGKQNGDASVGYLAALNDGVENLLDGLAIGAAYLISIPAGIATTIAVFVHEVPLELGDSAVLLHSGFSKWRAVTVNLLSGLLSVVGVSLVMIAGPSVRSFAPVAAALAAGAFIYLAASGLIPMIRQEGNGACKFRRFSLAVLGVVLMALLLLIE